MFDNFFPYSQKTLGYEAHPTVNFISDKENAVNPLGKTGFYDPSSKEITIYTDGRHIKDVLRSIAHELVHHAQNERGEFDHELDTSPGYALEDGHLWNMEQEAYKDGNSCFRRWEDTYKQQLQESKKMKSNKIQEMVRKELKKILSEYKTFPIAPSADEVGGMTYTDARTGKVIPKPSSEYGVEQGQVGPPAPVRTKAAKRRCGPRCRNVMDLQRALGFKGRAVDGRMGTNTRRRMRAKGLDGNDKMLNKMAMIMGDDALVQQDLAATDLGIGGDKGAADILAKLGGPASRSRRARSAQKLSTASKGADAIGQAVAGVTDGPRKFNWNAAAPAASPVAAPGAVAPTKDDDDPVVKFGKQARRSAARSARQPISPLNESKIRSKKAIRILNKLMEKIGNK